MCSIGAVGSIVQHLKLYLRDLTIPRPMPRRSCLFDVLQSGRTGFDGISGGSDQPEICDDPDLPDCRMHDSIAVTPRLSRQDLPFAIIFGIGLGGDYMIIPLMAADLFGIRALGRTMGIILVADGVAESLFPMLVGHLFMMWLPKVMHPDLFF